jgi:hypothetical protein
LAGSCKSRLLFFAESQQDAFLFLGLRFLSLRPPVVIAELCARHRPHLEGVIFSDEGEVCAEENLWALAAVLGVIAFAPGLYAGEPARQAQTVFVMTNNADHNEVQTFGRNPDGTFSQGPGYNTGGRGSGGVNDLLESQGSLFIVLVMCLWWHVRRPQTGMSARVTYSRFPIALAPCLSPT